MSNGYVRSLNPPPGKQIRDISYTGTTPKPTTQLLVVNWRWEDPKVMSIVHVFSPREPLLSIPINRCFVMIRNTLDKSRHNDNAFSNHSTPSINSSFLLPFVLPSFIPSIRHSTLPVVLPFTIHLSINSSLSLFTWTRWLSAGVDSTRPRVGPPGVIHPTRNPRG